MNSLIFLSSLSLARTKSQGESMRQFTADVLEGEELLVSGAQVELWTKRSDQWFGQLLYWANDKLRVGAEYLLRAGKEKRTICITDLYVIRGISAALFEQTGTLQIEPPRSTKRRKDNPQPRTLRFEASADAEEADDS